MLDLLIRDGLIVDGTGSPAHHGSIGIKGDKVVEVGEVTSPARRVIDAQGLCITPGFVDIHTHYDGQASWDGILAPSSMHGVTSIAMGNCGVGFAPAHQRDHDWLIGLLEGVEDIPGTALAEGLTWDWESFPDFLDALDRRQFKVDLGAHLPHAALRAYVMGHRGADHLVEPTDDELETMRHLGREALNVGALGFTTSRTTGHRTRDGASIGTLSAGERELKAMALSLADTGKGVIQLISDAYLTPDDEFAEAELNLIAMLARTSGRPLSFTVEQVDAAPDRWRTLLAGIDRMVAEGLDVKGQVAPRPIGIILGFTATPNPFVFTPTYKRLRHLPINRRIVELRRPEVRRAILDEHPRVEATGNALGILKKFSHMFRLSDPVDYEPRAEMSLQAEADRLNRDVVDYAYDVFCEQDGERLIYLPLINYSYGNLDDVYQMMSSPNALYGLSDAGAHCGTICDASFPTTTIDLWRRGSRSGHHIPLERLIQGYTSATARHVGWHDRGVLRPGYLADVNVIDLDGLGLPPPEVVADLPAGGSRLIQRARGYRWTIKSGVVSFVNGEASADLPGRLLRGARDLS
jgi:N-acyl-D-aspartate/D-glutamate deacylase